jgi:hypothetical protein
VKSMVEHLFYNLVLTNQSHENQIWALKGSNFRFVQLFYCLLIMLWEWFAVKQVCRQ